MTIVTEAAAQPPAAPSPNPVEAALAALIEAANASPEPYTPEQLQEMLRAVAGAPGAPAEEAPVDGVSAALSALVEAAVASPLQYTADELRGMLEEEVMFLSEGVVEWIRKKATGIDPDLIPEIDEKFKNGLTPAEKEAAIQRLSKAIVAATARIEKVSEWKRDEKNNPDEAFGDNTLADWMREARAHLAAAKSMKAKIQRAP